MSSFTPRDARVEHIAAFRDDVLFHRKLIAKMNDVKKHYEGSGQTYQLCDNIINEAEQQIQEIKQEIRRLLNE